MATDWIPMRVDLPRDPQVIAIADHIREAGCIDGMVCAESNVTRYGALCITVTALLHVWGACNAQGHADGDDLILKHARLDMLDHIAGIPGFGAAMASVEWAVEERGIGVRFPKFLIHNVPSAMRYRENNANRQRRYRERKKAEERSETQANPLRDSDATRNVTNNGTEHNSTYNTSPSNPPSQSSGGSKKKSSTSKHPYPDEFEALWKERPTRDGPNPKRKAWHAYRARLAEDYTHDQILQGMRRYRAWLEAKGKLDTEYTLQLATFLGPECHLANEWKVSEKAQRKSAAQEEARSAWKRLWRYLSGAESHVGLRSKDPRLAEAAQAIGGIGHLKLQSEEFVRRQWGPFLQWFEDHPKDERTTEEA